MPWTTKTPESPGWYFARWLDGQAMVVELDFDSSGTPEFYQAGDDRVHRIDDLEFFVVSQAATPQPIDVPF